VGQESIKSLLSRQGEVHVFYRTDDRSPFKYAGEAAPTSFQRTTPVQITWSFQGGAPQHGFTDTAEVERQPEASQESDELRFPEEIAGAATYGEGAVKQVSVNAYERSAKAVSACKAHYGTACVVCDFDFSRVYGEIGRGHIHVHHLTQLADIGKDYKVDPVKDLRPVCPNCHSMLHQRRPPLTIDELKKMIGRS
jgi:5-methylcytosine-specific restriction protein A